MAATGATKPRSPSEVVNARQTAAGAASTSTWCCSTRSPSAVTNDVIRTADSVALARQGMAREHAD